MIEFFEKWINNNLYLIIKFIIFIFLLNLLFFLIFYSQKKSYIYSNEVIIGIQKKKLKQIDLGFLNIISNKTEKIFFLKEIERLNLNDKNINCYFCCFDDELKNNENYIKLNLNENLYFYINEKNDYLIDLIEDAYYLII